MVPVASSKRKGKAKGRAVTRLAHHLDIPTLHLHQRAGDREAKTRSTNMLRGRIACPVEAGEQSGLLLRGQPDAAIADRYAGKGLDCLDREVDRSFLWGVFVRVGEQIAENLRHPVGITEDQGSCLGQMQGERLPPGVPAWLKGGYQFADEEGNIEGLAMQFELARLDAREV